jgi:hypothetical protein
MKREGGPEEGDLHQFSGRNQSLQFIRQKALKISRWPVLILNIQTSIVLVFHQRNKKGITSQVVMYIIKNRKE